MKTAKKYLIVYDGNLSGNEYNGEIISISDTKEDAQTILKEIVTEDEEIYGHLTPIVNTDTIYTAAKESDHSVLNPTKISIWCSYEIKEIEVYVRE